MIFRNNRGVLVYILLAFSFSVGLRLILVNYMNGNPQFMFNGYFMLNNPDGYYYAEGARDIIAGSSNTNQSPTNSSLSNLTAFLFKILPFSFENIIFYMPVFFSSLIVIPLILIAKTLNKIEVGFMASLFASVFLGFYERSMVGYYDTDLLNIFFPLLLLWSIILSINTKNINYLLFISIEIACYRWWYPQSYSLEFAFLGMIVLYTIYIIIKNRNLNNHDIDFNIMIIIFMMIGMLYVNFFIKIVLSIALFSFIKYKQEMFFKTIHYILLITIFVFISTGGIQPIEGQLKNYVFRKKLNLHQVNNINLHFFTVMQTVKESIGISFNSLVKEMGGNIIIFYASIIGYLWLIFKHRIMLFSIPMLGLGFLAYTSGVRFTMYGIPIMAFGMAFLIYEISNFIKYRILKYLVMIIVSVAVLFPNISKIIEMKIPTFFLNKEVKVLESLKKHSKKGDYTIAWWDYGYPIRYYSNTKTLIDGGRHGGSSDFPVSFILTHPQTLAAKMARLIVEYNEMNKTKSSNIAQIMSDYGFKNSNKFLNNLNNIKLPRKTRDIYIYLPYRMIDIYPTITQFSNIDLMTGKKKTGMFFYSSSNFKNNQHILDLGNDIKIYKDKFKVIIKGKLLPLHRFVVIYYDNKGLHRSMKVEKSGSLNLIYLKNANKFFLVDENVFNSLYFQLSILVNYDKNLFEPVILTPLVKLYKLKI